MADEGAAAGDSGGSEDAEASGMLADALNDEGTSQEDSDGEQFDAGKAKERIHKAQNEAKNLRKRIKELEPLADEAKKLRDSQKSELEKLTERASGAEERASSAELRSLRLEVALDKAPEGMPVSKIRALAKRLTGATQEELESDADELFAEFTPANGDDNGVQRPKERLGSVRLPNSDDIRLDDETDPRKLIEKFPRL